MIVRITVSCLFAFTVMALSSGCSRSKAASDQAEVEHGRYLVENVSMCIDCHSPRGQDGQWIEEQWLQGAQLPFAATVPMPAWAEHAPSLVGLPHYSDEELISLLTKGSFTDGRMLRPPMPVFAMNESDARAVVAFLRSLAPEAQ